MPFGQQRERGALLGGEAVPVEPGDGPQRLRSGPDGLEQRAERGQHPLAGQYDGTGRRVVAAHRDDGGRPVDDDHAGRQFGHGPDLAAEGGQPVHVLDGVRAVADTVQVDGAHPHAAVGQRAVERLGRLDVLRPLAAVRREGHDLLARLVGEAAQPVADPVEPDQLLDVGRVRLRPQVGVVGDELRRRGPGGLDPGLRGGQLGLLPRHQDLHPDVRGDRAQGTGPLGGGPQQGQLAQVVQGGPDLRLGQGQAIGQRGHAVPRVGQHGPVDGLRDSVQPQCGQHVRSPVTKSCSLRVRSFHTLRTPDQGTSWTLPARA